MSAPQNIVAVIFDFDDTLVPDSTGELLHEHGVDPGNFYLHDVKALVKVGYEPTHAYLRKLLDLVGEGKPLGPLTNDDLRKFGAKLDEKFFLEFDELRAHQLRLEGGDASSDSYCYSDK